MFNGNVRFDSRSPERLFKSKAPGLIGCDIGFVAGENGRDCLELAVEPKWHTRLYKVEKGG
jgi:hypothetical protein